MGQWKILGHLLKAWGLLRRIDPWYALKIVKQFIVILEDLHGRCPAEKFDSDVAGLLGLVMEHHHLLSPPPSTE